MTAYTVVDSLKPPSEVSARLNDLRSKTLGLDAQGMLEIALKYEFGGQTVVVSSFGAESAVLLHLVAKVDPNTPVIFLNTGKIFGETLRYRDRLQDQLGLCDVRSIGPDPRLRQQRDPDGILWSKDADACCDIRKVEPLHRTLSAFSAQITGRKRFQTGARANMERVEFFEGRFRFNPLADWSQQMLNEYMETHQLPPHPLVEDGYPSIGCMPCTRRVAPGEGYRDGRWAGLDKDECGIHLGLDGEGI